MSDQQIITLDTQLMFYSLHLNVKNIVCYVTVHYQEHNNKALNKN